MSPILHGMLAWLVAVMISKNVNDRRLIVIAGVIPDIDGIFILFDQAESPLYDLELELNEQYNFYNFEIIIGDITNHERINNVFETFKPSLVYHAAAYKHVPMLEAHPWKAVENNIIGTQNIVDVTEKFGCEKL